VRKLKALKFELKLKILSGDSKKIESLYLSLKPEESSQTDEKRGKVHITKDAEGKVLEIAIESESDGGFRALLNSYVYLVKASEDSLKAASR